MAVDGRKVALGLGALAVGVIAFWPSSSKAASSPGDPCAQLSADAAKAVASATKADVADLKTLAAKMKAAGCDTTAIDQKIKDLTGTVVTPPKPPPGTIPFTVAGIKDRQTLINDAWTLARMGPMDPTDSPPADGLEADGSFKNYADAVAYSQTGKLIQDVKDPGTALFRRPWTILTELQAAAGITPDGKYGAETEKAISWGLGNGSPSSIGGEVYYPEFGKRRPKNRINVFGDEGAIALPTQPAAPRPGGIG